MVVEQVLDRKRKMNRTLHFVEYSHEAAEMIVILIVAQSFQNFLKENLR